MFSRQVNMFSCGFSACACVTCLLSGSVVLGFVMAALSVFSWYLSVYDPFGCDR